MPDWSELQHDLLVLIVRRLNLIEDYLNFGTVCKSWHFVATKENFNSNLPRVPWLMLAEEEYDNTCRKFFSLCNGMILKKRIPKASGKRCMESMGWLITVGKDEGEISLLHPFSGVQIQLPHQNTTEHYEFNQTPVPWTFVQKAVLSGNPCHTSDYVLMVIEGHYQFLSFWRPGDLLWTRIRKPAYFPHISDVVYFSGHFYAVSYNGCVQVCAVVGNESTKSRIIAHLAPWIDGKYYILESLGSLFVVSQDGVDIRYVKDDRERIPLTHIQGEDDEEEKMYTYKTRNFLVFQIDLDTCKTTLTRDLGDRAFFLGANASLSVQASQFPGIKPNHIYFTDNCLGAYLHFEEGGGLDMGVFNLADGSIQPHYDGVSLSRVCPPIWVTPTPC
ncbi:probable F-box protein At1g65740 [Lycium barbarum]|uniref:probable F-box protein At1g65740 n=1 Tax=Lycium barbarum TaxID=112863 RepID=UPI00293E82C2|nr:probable F-box protein At1g65740 [Lycium barbarum]XP_060206838.1 probable F-box protein At1g65740 [Lycium barbarum]XP_060206839.1 probable F-box protein At1g65740 [Lycium barbarum]XP_060206840.1 probable F-box protein At1g65740 [Lycium barbarum]XP_060206842.1 probable F-box protein At1g65740 [Lycium barbarum]XP_060206843.1 probable F-box protein At1g65740 [Lycium barbarum]XP_060206844.1 probable F-box protein At1g65740 [Lycium barbarum]